MKICIVKLSAMGDIIHAMIVLQFVKKYYPDSQIDWIVEAVFAPVLLNNPHINQILPVNLKSIKKKKSNIIDQINLVKKYALNNYDIVIDAQGLIKSAIVSKLLKGKKTIGFSRKSTRESFASLFYDTKIDVEYSKNTVIRNMDLVCEGLIIAYDENEILQKEPFLFYNTQQNILDPYLSKQKKNILFVIGASWPSKMYPKEKFVIIINQLKEYQCNIIWGNEAEYEIAKYICKNSSAILLPKMSIEDLKHAVDMHDLVVGNDTGPSHMAWALNKPSLLLFGNTPGYRNTYETAVNKYIQSHDNVDPCKLDRDDYSIQDISTDEITAKIREMIVSDI